MNKWIENINNFITSNRKSIITILFFILIFSFDNSFAWDVAGTTPAAAPATTDKNTWYIPLVLMSALAGFSGSIIGFFINPEWTNWSIFGLTDQLKNLWVLTSNIVYFIFAFMLILMAFMNIIWHGKNEYEMKTALPKFIVWILIVPFSWFIVQFVVSISSILTVSVLSLPYDLYKPSIDSMNMDIPTNCTLDIDSASATWTLKNLDSTDESTRSWRINSIWKCEKSKKISQIFQWNSIFSIMSIYAYWILKINTMDTLKWSQLSDLKSLTDVFLKLWFDVIFLIAFLLLSLAIAMALFVRWVYLWLFMILSPAFWLFYFLWDKHRKKLQEQYSFTQFLSLALVPVYVSAALSFWLLFVLIAQNGIISSSTTWNWKFKNSWDTIQISQDDTFTIKWLPGSQKTNTTDWAKSLLWTMWSLFLIFVSIAILWIAVMAALWTSKITENIVKPIADFWWNVWKMISEAPKYAPILPGGMSMEWLNSASSSVKSSWESMWTQKWQEIWTRFADRLGLKTDEYIKHLEKLKTDSDFQVKIKSWNTQQIKESMPKLFDKLDISKDSNKTKLGDDLKTYLKYDIDMSKINTTQQLSQAIYTEMSKKTPSLNLNQSQIQSMIDNWIKWTTSTDLPKWIVPDTAHNKIIINKYDWTNWSNTTIKIDGQWKLDWTTVSDVVSAFTDTKNDFAKKYESTEFDDLLKKAWIKEPNQIRQIVDELVTNNKWFFTDN